MSLTAKPKKGFFIGVGCPGCGGELELDADFFVLGCRHCGSPLRVLMPERPAAFMAPSKVSDFEIRPHIDRYLKSEDRPLTGSSLHVKKLYYPYWKVDGTVLKLRNKTEIRKTYTEVDSSTVESVVETDRSTVTASPYHLTMAAGVRIEGIPDTLGMRSETVRAVPFSDENIENDFDPLPVIRRFDKIPERVRQAVDSLSQINPADFGSNITRLFNPVFSLVYFPFCVVEEYGRVNRRFIVDGLVGRVLRMITIGDATEGVDTEADGSDTTSGTFGADSRPFSLNDLETQPETNFGSLDVDFHRCTICGADLPPKPSHVYICGNCKELQIPDPKSRRISHLEAVSFESDHEVQFVPFWRLHLPDIMTGALGNLLGGLDRSEYLLVPALGSDNFEALHKLARRMSAAHARMSTNTVIELDDRYRSVRIGPDHACALAEMIVCRELVDHGFKLPENLEIKPLDYGLVYVPFHRENYFYIDTALEAVTVERVLID